MTGYPSHVEAADGNNKHREKWQRASEHREVDKKGVLASIAAQPHWNAWINDLEVGVNSTLWNSWAEGVASIGGGKIIV